MSDTVPRPPTPQEVYARAEAEGHRRLFMAPLDQVATGFIAGVTIIFGIVALALVQSSIEPDLGAGIAELAGAAAFGLGVVFLVVGRTELFSENFFGPVAAAIDEGGGAVWARLARLWVTILVLNLAGGAILVALLTVEGALPEPARQALVTAAADLADKGAAATVVRSVLAGALITLLSYMINAVDTAAARIMVAYLVGFLLALGPFDHVVVSVLQLLFGVWLSNRIGYGDVAVNAALSGAGNLAGGLLLITLTHTAQVRSE